MRISIITPSYNQAEFLENNFRSILAQNYENLEIIVIDGGSTDGSVEIIKKYESHFSFWQSQKDDGQSAAINEGMKKASGDIVTWLNSDDQLAPEALVVVAKYFEENPECKVLSGLGRRIDVEGNELEVRGAEGLSLDEVLRWKKYLPQASCFFRRELWEEVGGLDEALHFQMDYDLWLRFAQVTEFHQVDKALSYDLHHEEAKTVSKKFRQKLLAEYILVLSRYSRERYDEEIGKLSSLYLKAQSAAKVFSNIPGYNSCKKLFFK